MWRGTAYWDEVAVVIDERELLSGKGGDIVERLRAIPEDEVVRRREEVVSCDGREKSSLAYRRMVRRD